MLLLIDENVPQSVATFFAERGHEVKFVRDLFPGGTPDPVVATVGNQLSAIVVTWDRDFKSIASRVPKGNVNKMRNLGRISFTCDYADGRRQLERWIGSIELHFQQSSTRRDTRMFVEIQGNALKMW